MNSMQLRYFKTVDFWWSTSFTSLPDSGNMGLWMLMSPHMASDTLQRQGNIGKIQRQSSKSYGVEQIIGKCYDSYWWRNSMWNM